MSAATLTVAPETARDAFAAVSASLAFFQSALEHAPVDTCEARETASNLHAIAEAITSLADQAEALPGNVVDFAAAYRKRRDRIRAGGSP